MPKAKRTGRGTDKGNTSDEGSSQERFSAVTENYLLCLYKLWEDAVTPTVTQLTDTIKQLPPTEGLGSSVPSVAGMTRRMQKQGLVQIGSDKRIRLTQRGFEGGEEIARRHRLAEWLVVRLLGMDLHCAHIEAHRLEHGISGDLEAKLMERLGYPQKSPFGRPIPGAGAPQIPPNCVTSGFSDHGCALRSGTNTRRGLQPAPLSCQSRDNPGERGQRNRGYALPRSNDGVHPVRPGIYGLQRGPANTGAARRGLGIHSATFQQGNRQAHGLPLLRTLFVMLGQPLWLPFLVVALPAL